MKERSINGVAIFYLKGYIVDPVECKAREDRWLECLKAGQPVLVDLSETKHLNSYAIGALITANEQARKTGGQFKLCGLDKKIENIFVVIKLSSVFDIYPTEELALASFTSGGGGT